MYNEAKVKMKTIKEMRSVFHHFIISIFVLFGTELKNKSKLTLNNRVKKMLHLSDLRSDIRKIHTLNKSQHLKICLSVGLPELNKIDET